ncbi:hypothetical protein Dimus_003819, partial [Dionaea muscipula]
RPARPRAGKLGFWSALPRVSSMAHGRLGQNAQARAAQPRGPLLTPCGQLHLVGKAPSWPTAMHASRGLATSCGARGQRALWPPPSCGQRARAMRPPPGVRAAPRGLATTSIRAATSSVEGGRWALSPGGQPGTSASEFVCRR